MAKYINAKCRRCRKEGIKLFLKGEKCYSPKCPMVKKKYPPGAHGLKRQRRLTEYGLQLREKQKAKAIYGILERQFKNYFKKAVKKKGDTEKFFLKLLERRLDNVIYKSGLVTSRNFARQLISHNHILVNQKRVNIPSYQVKNNDIIKVKEKSKLFPKIKEEAEEKREILKWLSLDKEKLEIKVLRLPEEEDLPKEINTKLIVEFYSK